MLRINEPCPYCGVRTTLLFLTPIRGEVTDYEAYVGCEYCFRLGPKLRRKTKEEAQLEAIRGWKC